MASNTHYKQSYTAEECKACFEWFEKRIGKLPSPVVLPPADTIQDTNYTAQRLVRILKQRLPQVAIFGGEFSRMLLLKEVLQRDYGVE